MLRESGTGTPSAAKGPSPPHLVIVGLGQLGEALLRRAIKDWRIERQNPDKRMQVTIVDVAAEDKRQWLEGRYPDVMSTCNIDFVPLDRQCGTLL